MSRRDFVLGLASAGGYGAAYSAMQALGLLAPATARADSFGLPAASGAGKRVVILGAGIAGLVSAYELGKAGYDCVILEARERVGGRNWSIRRGTQLDMIDGSSQTCDFDEGLYFNAGPARLPSHHTTILGYCREFGVPLEVEVNSSRSSLLLDPAVNGGKPIVQRAAINDTRGYGSELLAKATRKGALDEELTALDKQAFLAFLKDYGNLNPDLFYKGSERSGYKVWPGAGAQTGEIADPLDFGLLMDPEFVGGELFEEISEMQATMFQPVGGMDQIPAAFEKRVGHLARHGVVASEIHNSSSGVKVTFRDLKTGKSETASGDFCICTIPLPVLAGIKSNFSKPFALAVKRTPYDHANKVAWQAQRFWETDNHIYGGLSFIKHPIERVWYPSGGFMSEKGILIGAYNFGDNATGFMEQPIAARLDSSRAGIEMLHPGRSKDLDKGITIAWNKVPYNLGPWVAWEDDKSADYSLLAEPDGRVYLAGEHISHINGWQEGAALSAQRAMRGIAARVAA